MIGKAALGAVFALGMPAGSADAQIFISGRGNDANICSRAAPCRTLQRGIDATGAGRVLTILDSGDYGPPATINKSITITAEGAAATIRALAAGSTALTAGGLGATIVLRNLLLTGGGTGETGIEVGGVSALYIERCTIERFTGTGISAPSAKMKLFVSDSVVRQNGADGLFIDGTNTTTKVAIDNSRFENNGDDGVTIINIQSTISDSLFSANAGTGVEQTGGRMNVTSTISANNGVTGYLVRIGGQMTLEDSVARGNAQEGLFVFDATSAAQISEVTITDNGTGIDNAGTVLTRRNSVVSGNTANLSGNALTTLGGT
jgi:hypothetical protein